MTQLVVIALIIGLLVAHNWVKQQPRAKQRELYARMAMTVGALVFILLLVRGINPLLALLAGLVPAAHGLLRFLATAQQIRRAAQAAGFGSAGAKSQQHEQRTSRSLRLFRRADDGAWDGELLEGPEKGRRLSEFADRELHAMAAELAMGDPTAAALLAIYLKTRGQRSDGKTHLRDRAEELREARQLLGTSAKASKEEIMRAHRRLIQRLHPDLGGSDYLAAKINQARDVLLRDLDEQRPETREPPRSHLAKSTEEKQPPAGSIRRAS